MLWSCEIRMSVFLHQVWRNVFAVNGCRQNERLIKASQYHLEKMKDETHPALR